MRGIQETSGNDFMTLMIGGPDMESQTETRGESSKKRTPTRTEDPELRTRRAEITNTKRLLNIGGLNTPD